MEIFSNGKTTRISGYQPGGMVSQNFPFIIYEKCFSALVVLSGIHSRFPDNHLSRPTIWRWLKELGDGSSDSSRTSLQKRIRRGVRDDLVEIVSKSPNCTHYIWVTQNRKLIESILSIGLLRVYISHLIQFAKNTKETLSHLIVTLPQRAENYNGITPFVNESVQNIKWGSMAWKLVWE